MQHSLELRKDKKGWMHYEIKFYPDIIDTANLFVKTFERIYQKKPSIRYVKNYYRVRVTSPVACKHLITISGFSKLAWRVPKKILVDNNSKKEFIRAIFDCEGCVGKRNIQFQSVNGPGVYDIKKLLKEFKINSSIYTHKRDNPNWNLNYIMVISRKENIKRFYKLVGFNHPIKQEKLAKLAGVPERSMGMPREHVSARTSRFES